MHHVRLATLPSPVATVNIATRNEQFSVLIPIRETWRIRQLFEKHEYGGVQPQFIRPAPIIFDVGANVGAFAIYSLLEYRPQSVHCFEPAPHTLDLLRQNLAKYPTVTIHPFALGQADHEADLYLDPANSGANSIIVGQIQNPVGNVRIKVRDAGAVWDELGFHEVDILKIDTEGCEVEVLKSLGSRVSHVRVVMAEYHKPEDRRQIDALLPGHILFGTLVHSLDTGVVKYVRADIADLFRVPSGV